MINVLLSTAETQDLLLVRLLAMAHLWFQFSFEGAVGLAEVGFESDERVPSLLHFGHFKSVDHKCLMIGHGSTRRGKLLTVNIRAASIET